MKTYFYTTEQIAAEAINCGLKLSVAANCLTPIYGKMLPCIETYLHPEDCPESQRSSSVLKIHLEDSKAFVADGMLTGARYEASMIAAKEYRLGLYRKPRCLIICSVFPEQIELYNPNMDEPILYESSGQLYRDTAFGRVQESDAFRELALRAHYEQGAANGAYVRIEENDTVLFLSESEGKIVFTFKKSG